MSASRLIDHMISVADAKKLILANCHSERVELVPITEGNNRILAESLYSLTDTPPFHQSAMDGYAFSFSAWNGKGDLNITGEIQAGTLSTRSLFPFEAVRIFTGAALPPGADTVIIQENVLEHGKHISLNDKYLFPGKNVRLKGSQTKKQDLVLPMGQLLTPPAISLLASTGHAALKVYSNPIVRILVTGKELIQPGHPLSSGKIYESNSFGLIAALNQLNLSPASLIIVNDNEEDLLNEIIHMPNTDILILTGGVSVGDYDFVPTTLEKCGVNKIFHKVKQKPGSPFYFGHFNRTFVFGLPGNPAAALTCFYEYLVDAISGFTHKEYFKKRILPLASDYSKKPGFTYFLKGKTSSDKVTVLKGQESYLLNSFAIADCIIELEESKENFRKGDLVSVHLIQ